MLTEPSTKVHIGGSRQLCTIDCEAWGGDRGDVNFDRRPTCPAGHQCFVPRNLQVAQTDRELTSIRLVPKIQVPENGGVVIELLVGTVAEKPLASYCYVGYEDGVT